MSARPGHLSSGGQVAADPPDPRDRTFPPDTDEYDRYQKTEADKNLDQLRHALDDVRLAPARMCDRYEMLADTPWTQWGQECTGFALSSIADYHLREAYRANSGAPDPQHVPLDWATASEADRDRLTVSRRMMYEMGQRYDRQAVVEGSTNRGALKGWNLLGVARSALWPYVHDDEEGQKTGKLTLRRVLDAVGTPGGAYLRIDKNSVTDMKKALTLNYPLLVSGQTHVGWIDLYLPGRSVIEPDDRTVGGHAFVIVGYDERGWRIHNSWGNEWGDRGYATLPYEDFAANGHDVWFVFPPSMRTKYELTDEDLLPHDSIDDIDTTAPAAGTDGQPGAATSDMWLHVIKLGDDGRLMPLGSPFGMDNERLKTMLFLFRQRTKDWSTRRLAIFADGGYWRTDTSLRQLGPLRDELLNQEIYPIFLLWETPWFSDTQGWLYGCTGETPAARDASSIGAMPYLDEDGLDPVMAGIVEFMHLLYKFAAVEFGTREIWDQLRVRAAAACRLADGGARLLADAIAYNRTKADFELHLIGHGAGDLLLAELATQLPAPIATCNLWAPASTMDDFDATYRPMLDHGYLRHATVTTLATDAEEADTMGPVPGSPLRLVSDVLAVDDLDVHTALLKVEDRAEEDGPDEYVWLPQPRPLLGLRADIETNDDVDRLRRTRRLDVRVVDRGTHVGLLTDDRVRAATIDDILAAATGADGVPLPPPNGLPLTGWLGGPGGRGGDPLDWWLPS